MTVEIGDKIVQYINDEVKRAFGIQDDEKIPIWEFGRYVDLETIGVIGVEIYILPNQLFNGVEIVKFPARMDIVIPDNIIY